MNVQPAELDGVLILAPEVYRDGRGWFRESWNDERYREAGVDAGFVQDNLSYSNAGVLRGLHYQQPQPQGKLVSVLSGSAFDVVVDLRTSSQTFGQWCAVDLSDENGLQLWIPPGFAHGFCVTSDNTLFHYKCSASYHRDYDRCLLWNDPDLGINWPVDSPQLSKKDLAAPRLTEIPKDLLF